MQLSKLTKREREIALLAIEGLSNKEIAEQLNISEGTAKIHLHNIYSKLGIKNRLALIARANDNSKMTADEVDNSRPTGVAAVELWRGNFDAA